MGALASLLGIHTAFFCLSRYLLLGRAFLFSLECVLLFVCLSRMTIDLCTQLVYNQTLIILTDLWILVFNLVRYKIVFNLKTGTPLEGAGGLINITRAVWMRILSLRSCFLLSVSVN